MKTNLMLRSLGHIASFVAGVLFMLVAHAVFALDDWRMRRITRRMAR